MEKNIKDYLHLYLGAEVEGGGNVTYALLAALDEISLETNSNTWRGIKPILRPLSDMTGGEADEFALLCLNSPHAPKNFDTITIDEIQTEVVYNDGGNMLDDDVEVYIGIACRCIDGYVSIMKDGRIGMSDENDIPTEKMKPVDDVYGKVVWLLSKHFDLFGLIESGLAIDKTKLP